MAVVGIEDSLYHVTEGDVVEVCAAVSSPSISCPVAFPFELTLSWRWYVVELTYSAYFLLLIFYCNYTCLLCDFKMLTLKYKYILVCNHVTMIYNPQIKQVSMVIFLLYSQILPQTTLLCHPLH